jgi:flagellar protein FlaG
LDQARKQANEALVQKGSELTFEFADDVDRVIVRLVDTRTREVIRQFPSEEMLQIARALKQEPAAGALLRTDA